MKVFLLVLAAQTQLTAEQVPNFREQVDVMAGAVLVRSGAEQLEASGLEVLVDGKPVQVLDVRPLVPVAGAQHRVERGPWTAQSVVLSPQLKAGEKEPGYGSAVEVAVVVMSDLCNRTCRQFGASHLQEVAENLVLLGPVRVVLSGPCPKLLSSGLDTPPAVREALEKIPRLATSHWLLWDRQEAFDISTILRRRGITTSALELMRLRKSLYELALALEAGRSGQVTVAFVLTNGFDSSGFSAFHVKEAAQAGLRVYPWELPSREWVYENEGEFTKSVRVFGRGLAAEGFVVNFVFPGIGGLGGQYYTAENRGSLLFQEFMTQGYDLNFWSSYHWLPLENATVGPREVAEATGGRIVSSKNPASWVLETLRDLYLVEYQAAEYDQITHGSMTPVAVYFRKGPLEVVSPYVRLGRNRLAGEASALAALELRQRLGVLPLEVGLCHEPLCQKHPGASMLWSRANLAGLLNALRARGSAHFRVTVAVHMRKGEPFVHQEEFQQAVDEGSEGTVWTYEAPISLPKEAERLAVVVEELQTGAWGAAVLDLKGEGKP